MINQNYEVLPHAQSLSLFFTHFLLLVIFVACSTTAVLPRFAYDLPYSDARPSESTQRTYVCGVFAVHMSSFLRAILTVYVRVLLTSHSLLS